MAHEEKKKHNDPNPPEEAVEPRDDAEGSEIDALKAENQDLREKMLRWQADFQNYQRRSAREVLEVRQRAEAEFARDLLVVLDHLEAAIGSSTDYNNLINGVKITDSEFRKLLANRGIEAFDATGQPFDPHQHEAVSHEPSDKHPPMTVTQTYQAGYKSGDKVLRPAKVKVSK